MTPRSPEQIALLAEAAEAAATESACRAAPAAACDALGMSWVRRGGGLVQLAPRIDVLMYNRAFGLGLETPLDEAELDTVLELHRAARPVRFFIQVAPGAQPANLPELLQRRGFVRHNRWMRLWRTTDVPPIFPTPLRIERIGPERAATFGAIVAEAFQLPPAMEAWTAATVGRDGWQHYVAYDRETAIGTGAMYLHGEVAWLGEGATLSAHRGRGALSALLAGALVAAAAHGCRWATSETAEDLPGRPAPSFRAQIRFGFEAAYARDNWLTPPPPAPISPPTDD